MTTTKDGKTAFAPRLIDRRTALKALGMPTTILIDKDGLEIGRLAGPAEWDGAEAKGLIASFIK